MRGPAPRPPGMRIMSGPVGAPSRTPVLYGNIYHISRGALTSLARARPRDVRATAVRNGCPLPLIDDCLALLRDDAAASSVAQKILFFPNGAWCPPPGPFMLPSAYTQDSRTSYYLGGIACRNRTRAAAAGSSGLTRRPSG